MNFKVAVLLQKRRRENEKVRRPLGRRSGKDVTPKYRTVEVAHMGSIDCGRVLPFMPASELVTVAIPEGVPETEVFTLRVRGISLSDLGILDGDLLICRRRVSIHQITERTVCAVFVHSTGELVAKRIIRQANTLLLRASGGDIPDREVSPDEIEIRGIVTDVQRSIENFGEDV